MKLTGYREVVRVREDGKIEVAENGKSVLLNEPRSAQRLNGVPPFLGVTLAAKPASDALELTATARVIEKSASVYYTLGADTEGVYHNARVAFEIYGPGEQDYLFLRPDKLKPRVREIAGGAEVEGSATLTRPGSYRLRAATVDTAGRTTVVWRSFTVAKDPVTRRLTLQKI
jgi:hypothetical protein